jgi:hypothetical protein
MQDKKTVEIVSTCYVSLCDDNDDDDDDDDDDDYNKNYHPSLLQVNLRFVKTRRIQKSQQGRSSYTLGVTRNVLS